MAEDLNIITGSKVDQYDTLFPQIKALLEEEEDLIANLANIAAALKEQFDFFWVGFYLVKNDQLVLGPFQGPVACTRIRYNKGVCGTAWAQEKSLIVPNVEEFPGHISCNSLSKSEIVIPLYKNKQIIGVLDVDSNKLDDFDHIDEVKLTKILSLID
ncbi:GAF domain-containing protein [Sphingobacterium lumbrici]|uniref:GAF domain-containing protein n=1 Tax=Sphingobacterium lumbrici TaxID=2559600 RepID=UPI00112BF062|nr:GAF domain-containing protein [Sphingobacterium lumbrici]